MNVTEYLERARECAALAERMKDDDKKRLLEIADAWLKLAGDAAEVASKSNSGDSKMPLHLRR